MKPAVVAALLAVLGSGAGATLRAQETELPGGFYIVSMAVSDAAPFWFHYILDVRADGRDSVVRYIRVAPLDSFCGDTVTVKAATARLPGVSPSDLLPQANLCAIDSASINRDLRRRTRKAAIDDSVREGIVATCGQRTVTVHLPFPEQVNLDSLRKRKPQLARWWDVQDNVKQRAFGSARIFYGTTAAQEEQYQRDGQAVVQELLSGRFDAGRHPSCRQPCRPSSFRDDLRYYVGPLGEALGLVKFLQAGQYRLSLYVPPRYPPLARQQESPAR